MGRAPKPLPGDARIPTPVFPQGAWIGSRFEIVCRLLQTGPERTYLGRDHSQGGESVILQMLPAFRVRPGFPQTALQETFKQTRKLKHLGLLRQRDLVLGAIPLLASDYIEGFSLGRMIGSFHVHQAISALPIQRSMSILRQLASTLDYLHSLGFIHGDLRPEVVWVGRDGIAEVTKILGFALAGQSILENPDFPAVKEVHPCRAPEWIRGDKIGTAADVYGLAALAHWMLAGSPPYQGPSLPEKILKTMVPPVGGVPHGANHVLMRALDRTPAERYRSATALIEDLDRTLKGLLPQRDPLETRWIQNETPRWLAALQRTFWSLAIFLVGVFTLVYVLRY